MTYTTHKASTGRERGRTSLCDPPLARRYEEGPPAMNRNLFVVLETSIDTIYSQFEEVKIYSSLKYAQDVYFTLSQ